MRNDANIPKIEARVNAKARTKSDTGNALARHDNLAATSDVR